MNALALQKRPLRAGSRRHRKKALRAKPALWARLGEDALPAILILLIVALPLAAAVSSVSPRRQGLPGALFESGGVCLLLVMLWRARLRPVRTQALAWARRGPTLWLLALLGWNVLSALAAPDRRFPVLGLFPMAAGIVVYAAAASQSQSRRLRALLDSMIGSTLLASLLALFVVKTSGSQALTANDTHLVHYGLSHLARSRTEVTTALVTGTGRNVLGNSFGDPHLLTAFLILMLPLLLPVVFPPARLIRRLSALAAILAGASALVLTHALPFAALLLSLIWLAGHPQHPGLSFVSLLLWCGFLAAFFVTGLRALRRLPSTSLRQRLLIGALAGVTAQSVDALVNPAGQGGESSFFLWLLLGLAQACASESPAPRSARSH